MTYMKKHIIRKESFYFDGISHFVDEDMIIKDEGITDHSSIFAVKNEYVRIISKIKNERNVMKRILNYLPASYFKVMIADKHKEIKVWNEKILNLISFYLNYYNFDYKGRRNETCYKSFEGRIIRSFIYFRGFRYDYENSFDY